MNSSSNYIEPGNEDKDMTDALDEINDETQLDDVAEQLIEVGSSIEEVKEEKHNT